MYSYILNDKAKIIKQVNSFTDQDIIAFSREQFDLDLYDIYVSVLSKDKEILSYTKLPKSDIELVKILKEQKEMIADLNSAIAELYGGNIV